jgi:riboflavin kinase / FMN adenylyltransferase
VQVLTPAEVPRGANGSAVTIGAYDGVHLGHRRLLALLRARADALGVPAAVVTFDHHPATVVRPESAPLLLTDTEQKLELLESCGVDLVVVVRFDPERANETAEEFVDEVLCGALGAKVIVVGEDFHFGHGRRGDVAMLRLLGAANGFEVVGLTLAATGDGTQDGVRADGDVARGVGPTDPVSSTRIRALVAAGDVAAAARLLGRPHEVRGAVVHGDGRGAQLGMPTANVEVPDGIAVPAVGIYAGWCRRADGSFHPAAISVGFRPTFAPPPGGFPAPLVEVHLIGFDGELYGERVGVAFVDRLREERRFERVEDLVDQMWADVDTARRLLAGTGD